MSPAASDKPAVPGVGSLRLLATLAALFVCWIAGDLIVTILLALLLALLANPIVTLLRKLWIPRWLGAIAVLLGGIASVVLVASLLIGPASDWVKQAPTQLRHLAPKLRTLTRQVDQANKTAASIVKATGAAVPPATVTVSDQPTPPNLWSLLASTPRRLASALATILLAFSFLVYGGALQQNAIERLPREEHRRLAQDILEAIETDLSRYVITISLINIVLGLLLMATLWWLGLAFTDALLWGTVAALLNYIPYVGPLTGVVAMALVGVVAFDDPGKMILPPLIYLGLHVLESQVATPNILGRRLAISPLVMLLWLMLWGWLWGVAGLLLAVPMLACVKITADRVERWHGWARLIG